MSNRGIIIAHRGESFDAPENTLGAINLAWQRGADAVEIDIDLSRDDEIVVTHDYSTRQIWGKSKAVRKQTLGELKTLKPVHYSNKEWQDEKIPTLSEVLRTVPEGGKILIEIKSSVRILPFLKREIDISGLKYNQVELIGFNRKTMIKAKRIFPEHLVFWVLGLDYYWIRRFFKPLVNRVIKKAQDGGLDGIDVWAGNMLNSDFVNRVKSVNLHLYCWTVNDPEKAKQLLRDGVDGVTSDRAAYLMGELFNEK